MKVRNGFVSNSSSSSFVVFGKTLTNPEEVRLTLSVRKKPALAIGRYLSEGMDVIEVDEEIFNAIIENNIFQEFQFLFPYKQISGEGGLSGEAIENDLPETFEVFSGEVDYHSTETVEDLVRIYVEEKEYYQ